MAVGQCDTVINKHEAAHSFLFEVLGELSKFGYLGGRIKAARALAYTAAARLDAGEEAREDCFIAKPYANHAAFEVVTERCRSMAGFGTRWAILASAFQRHLWRHHPRGHQRDPDADRRARKLSGATDANTGLVSARLPMDYGPYTEHNTGLLTEVQAQTDGGVRTRLRAASL